jgi:putative peptidoglycan lipid II flippase
MRSLQAFFGAKSSVRQASTLLAITALLSNGLGLGRNLIFYRLVEPGILDAYVASFRVADFIFNLLIFGAITSAVIPVISELLTNKQEKKAFEITNQLLSLATLFFIGLTLLLALIMPALIRFLVSGFDAERTALTITLSRILLLQTIFFSWSFIIGALLNGYRRFATYAFAPLVYNAAIIIGGLLYPQFGVVGMAISVVVGAFFHFLIQYREALSTGFRPAFRPIFSSEIREISYLMLPRSISQGMTQLVLTVYTFLASSMPAGSISIFSGINDLQTTPTVIIGNSLATAFFPTMAALISQSNWEEMNKLFTKVVRVALFLLLPTIVLLFTLRAQIIRLYVGIGRFSWDLTGMGIQTFSFFLIGIIPASLVAILARVLYGVKDTRTPMVISLISGGAAIVIAEVGVKYFHFNVATLAFAESAISLIQAVLYFIVLHRKNHLQLPIKDLLAPTIRYAAGAILLGLSSWATLRVVNYFYGLSGQESTTHVSGLLIQSALSAMVGICVYFSYSTIVNPEELSWLHLNQFLKKK